MDCYKSLFLPLKGAKPETKFFLVKLLKKVDLLRGFSLNINEYVVEFGMTTQAVINAIRFLLEQRLLTKVASEKPRRSRRGRPVNRYRITADLREKIEDINQSVLNAQGVDYVLQATTIQGIKLSVSNRLLLAVMLAHSNQLGFVTSLSHRDMQQLTSMSLRQVASQLKKLYAVDKIDSCAELQKVALIHRVFCGKVCPNFLGRVISIYQLNMDLLCPSSTAKGIALLTPKDMRNPLNFVDEKSAYHSKYKVIYDRLVVKPDSIPDIDAFMWEANGYALRLARLILSRYEPTSAYAREQDLKKQSLSAEIQERFSNNTVTNGEPGGIDEDKEIASLLVSLITDLAIYYNRLMSKIERNLKGNGKIVFISPLPWQRRQITLYIL